VLRRERVPVDAPVKLHETRIVRGQVDELHA
jgi:hypothetical protein